MALYHKWDVKNGFAYVLQFFSLFSDGLGGVTMLWHANSKVHILAKNCVGQKTKAFKCLLGKLQQKLRLLQECAKKKQKFSVFWGFSTVFFKLLSNTC